LSKTKHGVKTSQYRFDQEKIVAGNQDMRAANESYAGFLTIFKWGTVLSVLTTILVVLVIA
jgi:hypothetical protein